MMEGRLDEDVRERTEGDDWRSEPQIRLRFRVDEGTELASSGAAFEKGEESKGNQKDVDGGTKNLEVMGRRVQQVECEDNSVVVGKRKRGDMYAEPDAFVRACSASSPSSSSPIAGSFYDEQERMERRLGKMPVRSVASFKCFDLSNFPELDSEDEKEEELVPLDPKTIELQVYARPNLAGSSAMHQIIEGGIKPVNEYDEDEDDEADDDDDDDEDEEQIESPVPSGGGITDRYIWNQDATTVCVLLPVVNATASSINVQIGMKTLSVTLKATGKGVRVVGPRGAVIDGSLGGSVVTDESSWTISKGKDLLISLRKKEAGMWRCCVVGDPEICVTKLDLENQQVNLALPDVKTKGLGHDVLRHMEEVGGQRYPGGDDKLTKSETPSYFRLPLKLQSPEPAGDDIIELKELNRTVFALASSDSSGASPTKIGENLFKREDQFYELDLEIARVKSAITRVKSLVSHLPRRPLRRLTAIHRQAIRSAYLPVGCDALRLLDAYPAQTLPYVLKHLTERRKILDDARKKLQLAWEGKVPPGAVDLHKFRTGKVPATPAAAPPEASSSSSSNAPSTPTPPPLADSLAAATTSGKTGRGAKGSQTSSPDKPAAVSSKKPAPGVFARLFSCLKGRHLRKDFGEILGVFEGKVKFIWGNKQAGVNARVVYTDEDEEDLELGEVLDLLTDEQNGDVELRSQFDEWKNK